MYFLIFLYPNHKQNTHLKLLLLSLPNLYLKSFSFDFNLWHKMLYILYLKIYNKYILKIKIN